MVVRADSPDGSYDSGPLSLGDRNAPTDVSCRWVANGYWEQDTPPVTIRADETSQQDTDMLPICQGATIRGTVVDASTGLAIQGALLSAAGVNASTDANGDYELDNVSVGFDNTPIDVGVTAQATGYITATKSVTVFCGGSISLDFGRQNHPGHIVVVEKTNPSGSAPSVRLRAKLGHRVLTHRRPVQRQRRPHAWLRLQRQPGTATANRLGPRRAPPATTAAR